jgi:tetratricopeptide (TPR) repeat protein
VALEKHPNVFRCFFMGKVDNTPFLFLEWVAGEQRFGTDLRQWLNRRGPSKPQLALKPQFALQFAIDVCRALVHAQNKVTGLVHCDIKPDNVLVAQGQLAKLSDFGLAKLVREAGLVPPDGAPSAGGARCQVSSAGGTPPYMSPEQWRGEAVDARTDIYAVGCLLYELLTGRWAFPATTVKDLKQQHLESPAPPLGVALSGSPREELDRLLARCLAKEPGDRYTSASELMDAIAGLYEAWQGAPPRGAPEVEGFTAADYINRGLTYVHLGSHAEALADCDAAIQIDSRAANAYCNRGLAFAALGRHAEALVDYDTAVQLDPNLVPAHLNRGTTYAGLGRYKEALDDFGAAVRLDPNGAEAHYNRGLVHYNLGQYEEALAEYDAAVRLDPNDAPTLVNRGITYHVLGRYEGALADFDAALQRDPDDASTYYIRGSTYHALGRFEEALADHDAALRLDPNHARAHVGRGNVHGDQGRHFEALADYEAAIRIDPNYGLAYFNKGVAHTRRGQWDDAIHAFETAAQLGDATGAQYAAQIRRETRLPPIPSAADPAQQAFEAFMEADSPDALRRTVDLHPILARPGFLASIEQVIADELPPAEQLAFRQRLDWFRQPAAPKANP